MSEMRTPEKPLNNERAQKKKARSLIRRSTILKATVWIGKNGVTNELIKQIDNQLEKRSLVKISAHQTIISTSSVDWFAAELSRATNSNVIDIRGRGFTLYRERQKPPKTPQS